MSGTVTGRQADEAAPAPPAYAERSSRSRLRRWVIAAVVLVVIAAAVVVAVLHPFGTSKPAGTATAGSLYPTSTTVVSRQTLQSQTEVSANLGDSGSYTVVNQSQGTLTSLPALGRVVRLGQVLYRVDGSPVVLLYGSVPMYRDLSEGLTGRDVTELNDSLISLGYTTRALIGSSTADLFSGETAAALEKLQARLAIPQTGFLTLGQAVFLPTAATISSLGAGTVLGGPVQPGEVLLTASSTTRVVTIDLDPSQQTEVKVGDRVTITLPSNHTTPGLVTSVSSVVTAASSGASGGSAAGDSASGSGSGDSSGGDSGPTITVEVRPLRLKAIRGLDQAPVEVSITTGRVRDALVVPVDALLAQAPGGYAVEVAGPGQARHLVRVSLGLFDDANGLVQVTGPGLVAGQQVVVPAT